MRSPIRIPAILIILIILFLALWSRPAVAGWSNDPAVNNPVCTEPEDQSSPAIISDGSSGSIIVWEEDRGSNGIDIYAQRLGPAGDRLWPADGMPVCTASGTQTDAMVVTDHAGGAMVIWRDDRTGYGDIFAQRLDADGDPLWTANGVPVCSYGARQSYPRLVADGTGGAIAIWDDQRTPANEIDIYAQRISPSGAVLWQTDGVAVCTADMAQTWTQIFSDDQGGAIISWVDHRWWNADIRAQRLDHDGNLLWNEEGVMVCVDPEIQGRQKLVSDGASGAIICWNDGRSGTDLDIYAQRINAIGQVQWAPDGIVVSAEADHQENPRIFTDGRGGALICWEDQRTGSRDIYAQRVSGGGSLLWSVSGEAICTAPWDQFWCQMVEDGQGGVYLAWHDYRINGNRDIYAQRLDLDGNALWQTDGVLVFGAANDQTELDMVSLGWRGAVISCLDLRNGADYDIYAQWVDAEGRVGGFEPNTVFAQYSCSPSSGRVPFTTQMSTVMTNSYTELTRRISAVINVRLANGGSIANWRAGFTNLGPQQSYQASWAQYIPAVASMIGTSYFTMRAEDVTPAPYNHPPYPSSGDVDLATCSVTASLP